MHRLSWAGPGNSPSKTGRAQNEQAGPCCQQLPIYMPTYKSNRTKNVHEPGTSTRLTVTGHNCHLRSRQYTSLKIINPPAASKCDGLGPDLLGWPAGPSNTADKQAGL